MADVWNTENTNALWLTVWQWHELLYEAVAKLCATTICCIKSVQHKRSQTFVFSEFRFLSSWLLCLHYCQYGIMSLAFHCVVFVNALNTKRLSSLSPLSHCKQYFCGILWYPPPPPPFVKQYFVALVFTPIFSHLSQLHVWLFGYSSLSVFVLVWKNNIVFLWLLHPVRSTHSRTCWC